ncbi:MAG: reverse transcriptase domain-containing protein, partial [Ruminococcus sp.]
MNDNYSTTAKAERLSNLEQLEKQWISIDWKKAELEVNRLQIRIAKAVQKNKFGTVKRLQYLLTHSFYAKALAVRKVTTNKGKNTSGVDKELWSTPASKMRAVLSLTDKNYKAKPLRRVYIAKKGKKTKRPLGIPCMYDRAMQALYAFALEPVAETTADTRSFGFRKGRSCHDACEYIFTNLAKKNSAEWVLEGDIKGCFDHISHKWLIDNIPMDKSILKQFLKAGFVFNRELFPTDEGTPQGGIISPILANMALDGIQAELIKNFDTNLKGKYSSFVHDKHKVNLVRYADDFIVTAATKEIAEKAKSIIRDFLKVRGLELSEEKTLITHINEGFDMLGWTFRKFKGKLIVKPSKKSIK